MTKRSITTPYTGAGQTMLPGVSQIVVPHDEDGMWFAHADFPALTGKVTIRKNGRPIVMADVVGEAEIYLTSEVSKCEENDVFTLITENSNSILNADWGITRMSNP